MNHVQNFVRLLIVFCWLVAAGVVFKAATGEFNNFLALGMFGLLLYSVIGIIVVYGLVLITRSCWSIK